MKKNKSVHLRRHKMLCVALISIVVTACNPDKTDIEYIEQAKLYRDSGELAKSGIELKNALRVNPENSEARRLLGMLYLVIGNGEGAEKELRRALELKISYQAVALPILQAVYMQRDYKRMLQQIKMPDGLDRDSQAEWYVLRGRGQLEMGRLAEARAEFSTAARIAPDAAQTQLGRALDSFFSKQYGAAEIALNLALARNPRFAEALTLKGDLLQLQGKSREAESLYTQAIAARSNNSLDIYKRARLRLSLNETQAAEADIASLVVRVPNAPEVNFLRGILAIQQSHLESAEAFLRDADRLRPGDAEIQFYLASALAMRNQPQQARALLESIVVRQPGNYPAAKQLSGIYVQADMYDDARKLLERFFEEKSSDVEYLTIYTSVLLRTGAFSDAIVSARKLKSLDANSARASVMMGSALLGVARIDEALGELDQAILKSPESGVADTIKVKALISSGKFSEALSAAKAWQSRMPGDIEASLAVAEVNRRLKNAEAAREAYSKVLVLQANNSEAIRGLAFLDISEQRPEDARSRYEQLWKQYPGNVDAALVLARYDMRRGNAGDGVRKLETAIDRNPDDLRPRTVLARYYLDGGQQDRALALLRPVEGKYGSDPSWLLLMVEAMVAVNNPGAARDLLDRLESTGGGGGIEAYWRARIFSMTGQEQLVLGQLETAYRLLPNDMRTGVALFRKYGQSGEYDKAWSVMTRLDQVFPGDAEILAQMGWLAARQGDYKKAVKSLQSAYQKAPSQSLLIDLARAEVQSGNPDAAVILLRDGLDKTPVDGVLVRELAELYALTGQESNAVAVMRNAVSKGLKDPVVLNNLAWLSKGDNPAQALKYSELAVELAPQSAGIKDTLGQILIAQGQQERGLRMLADAARLEGGSPGIRLHYAQALVDSGLYVQAKNELKAIEGAIANDQSSRGEALRKKIAEIRSGIKN